MRDVYAELTVELVEFNGETDYVHLLVAHPPTPAISVRAQGLKGRSAYSVQREFTGACIRARMRGHLGSPPTSPSPAAAHRRPSSSNTSTDTPDHSERRAPPDHTPDGPTPH